MNPPCEVYNPERTFLVDRIGPNCLFRGNIPLNADGSFAYDAMAARFAELVPGLDLTRYTFFDFSLIDNQGELPELADEFEAFGAGAPPSVWPPFAKGVDIFARRGSSVCGHPGSLFWTPVQGCTDAANCQLVENPLYAFARIVDAIAYFGRAPSPTVTYWQCMNGHDRAGALTACYQMKYMGRTRAQAMDDPPPEGAKAMKHAWHATYGPLIEWYASMIGR